MVGAGTVVVSGTVASVLTDALAESELAEASADTLALEELLEDDAASSAVFAGGAS
ncbi:hypothetical protein AEAC466_11395 [Asticcacaulis sp. AC466]|nr:hypothetical protein AEAC466_11395 [Asticcacaulis sp. AC466]